MTAIVIAPALKGVITPSTYGRNGQVVSVQGQYQLVTGYNQLARYRTRELFNAGGQLNTIVASAGAGPTVFARGYGFTSTFAKRVRVAILMAKPSSSAIADPYVRFDVQTTGGASVGTPFDAHFGAATGTPADDPSEWPWHMGTIDVSPSTQYQYVLSTYNNARIVTATAWEESNDPDTANGYMTGATNTGPIFDSDRSGMLGGVGLNTMCSNNGGTQVTLTDVARAAFASATDTNIFDQTSTTVTAATPGMTLDLRYKNRRSATTVPVGFAVYGSCAAGSNGRFRVKDSGGTTLLTVGPFSTTPGWVTGAVSLPATQAKYDLMISTAASTFTLNYVSIYE
jgi:hypothetical protein